MAWNEPGNGKDKDPWGNRNDDGPPDLDEIFKKAQDGITKLFGGGNGRNNGSGSDGTPINPLPIVMGIVVVLVMVLGFSSAYTVQQAEQAVVLRAGKYLKTEGPGLKFKIPFIDEKFIIDVQEVRSMQLDGDMLTADNNIVTISVVVQFELANPRNYILEITQPKESLHHATESALREVVGGMTLDEVLTNRRQEVASLVMEQLQVSMDRFSAGILVTEVSMQNAHPPTAVKAAFDDVNKAKEDEERYINEAQAYYNGIIPEARGMAQRQLAEAEGYKQSVIAKAEGEADRFTDLLAEYRKAPGVTRKRMYIETMEEVLSNSTKVMVDVEGGNNMLYLPLDRLVNQGALSTRESEALKKAVKETVDTAKGSVPRGGDRIRQYRERNKELR